MVIKKSSGVKKLEKTSSKSMTLKKSSEDKMVKTSTSKPVVKSTKKVSSTKTKKVVKKTKDQLTTKTMKKAIDSIKDSFSAMNDTNDNGKRSLFDDAAAEDFNKQKLHLEILTFKVPEPHERNRPIHPVTNRFSIPHTMTDGSTNVLLVTRDYPKLGADVTLSNAHHKTMLTNSGCNILVTEIMALSQLKSEYKESESLKNLCHRIDIVLCDSGITKVVPRVLGKPFQDAKKFPIGIKLGSKDLKKEIQNKLSMGYHKMTFKNTQSALTFGHCSQSTTDLTENLVASVEYLKRKLPGGWPNVRSLYLTAGVKARVPLYVSQGTSADVGEVIVERPVDEVLEGDFGFGNVRITSSGRLLDYTPDSDDEEIDEELIKQKAKRRRIEEKIDEKGYLLEKEIDEEIENVMKGKITYTTTSVKSDSKKKSNKNEVKKKLQKKKKSKKNKSDKSKDFIFTTHLEEDIV